MEGWKGKKESQILYAEGEKQAAILKAEATRQSKVLEATGEAEALLKVQEALALSIEKLNASNPSSQVLTLKSLDALAKVANGNATKLIIPSELTTVANLVGTIKVIAIKE
jgi:regulator of protease activity HflC (stomatin/prohibitin superfamily)